MKSLNWSKRAILMQAAVAVLGFGISDAFAQVAAATTPTTTANVAAAKPRYYGSFSAASVDKTVYTAPACPKFVFDIDPIALDESTDKAYIRGQIAKVPELRARFRGFENCLLDNIKLDLAEVHEVAKISFDAPNALEAQAQEKSIAKTKEAFDRISALAKKKKLPTTPEPEYVSTWKAPVGRLFGTVSGQIGKDYAYKSGCPIYLGEVTDAELAAVQTPKRYEQLAANVLKFAERRNANIKCRNENTQPDYEVLAGAAQRGFDEAYLPVANHYKKQMALLDKAISSQNAGGSVAVRPVSKPVAKPAVKPAPKKK